MPARRRTPSQQRSRFTCEVILEAAAHVVDREGVAATTNRIAERAGVSIGSLYAYFPDKYALLHELATRHIAAAEELICARLAELRAAGTEPRAALHDLVQTAVRANAPLTGLHSTLREHTPRSTMLVRRFQDMIDRLTESLAEYLFEQGTAGWDRDELRVRVRLAIAGLDNQIHTVVLNAPTTEDRAKCTALITEQALSTILPPDRPGQYPVTACSGNQTQHDLAAGVSTADQIASCGNVDERQRSGDR